MKLLKFSDLFGQVLMLVLGLTLCFLPDNTYWILPPYFLAGGWQLVSFFIHLGLTGSWIRQKERKLYGTVIFWTAIIGLIGCILLHLNSVELLFCYLFALLFVTPGFAIWYFLICWHEYGMIRKRELIHLK